VPMSARQKTATSTLASGSDTSAMLHAVTCTRMGVCMLKISEMNYAWSHGFIHHLTTCVVIWLVNT